MNMANTTDALRAVDLPRLVRLRCPDCKVPLERCQELPPYESIECPRCERFVMRMFWITLSQTNVQAVPTSGADTGGDTEPLKP